LFRDLLATEETPQIQRYSSACPSPPHEYASSVLCAPGVFASAFARPLAGAPEPCQKAARVPTARQEAERLQGEAEALRLLCII